MVKTNTTFDENNNINNNKKECFALEVGQQQNGFIITCLLPVSTT